MFTVDGNVGQFNNENVSKYGNDDKETKSNETSTVHLTIIVRRVASSCVSFFT